MQHAGVEPAHRQDLADHLREAVGRSRYGGPSVGGAAGIPPRSGPARPPVSPTPDAGQRVWVVGDPRAGSRPLGIQLHEAGVLRFDARHELGIAQGDGELAATARGILVAGSQRVVAGAWPTSTPAISRPVRTSARTGCGSPGTRSSYSTASRSPSTIRASVRPRASRASRVACSRSRGAPSAGAHAVIASTARATWPSRRVRPAASSSWRSARRPSSSSGRVGGGHPIAAVISPAAATRESDTRRRPRQATGDPHHRATTARRTRSGHP